MFKTYIIDQKTLVPFIYIAIILIGIDMIATAAGFRLGLEEDNSISLIFVNIFGSFYGLMASISGKCLVLIFPMIAYQYIEKELETTFLRNTYNILYLIFIIIAIMTTLRIVINNIIAIIGQLQYQDYVHSLSTGVVDWSRK